MLEGKIEFWNLSHRTMMGASGIFEFLNLLLLNQLSNYGSHTLKTVLLEDKPQVLTWKILWCD